MDAHPASSRSPPHFGSHAIGTSGTNYSWEAPRPATDTTTANFLMLLMGTVSLLAVLSGAVLGIMIAKMIAAPANKLVAAANRISEGDIDIQVEVESQDEIGELATAFQQMIRGIQEQGIVLDSISQGDYTHSIATRSDKDVVNRAITRILDNNNSMMQEIRTASGQVSTGAQQISQAAQNLASGSSQQAASVQEFSATLTEVMDQTNHNAENAQKAMEATQDAKDSVEKTSDLMARMLEAMNSIDAGSKDITKVIKVIEDIAFQTNILALNAAVEAARAGQHGKGFAVVADEVRNLASKSATAARETASLIADSSQRVSEGNHIVEMTNACLNDLSRGTMKVVDLIGGIANSSLEQSKAITEMNQGLDQISQVVQANSATAEESAASAQEMSAQATVLNETVNRFKLRDVSAFGDSTSFIPSSDGFSLGFDDSDKY